VVVIGLPGSDVELGGSYSCTCERHVTIILEARETFPRHCPDEVWLWRGVRIVRPIETFRCSITVQNDDRSSTVKTPVSYQARGAS